MCLCLWGIINGCVYNYLFHSIQWSFSLCLYYPLICVIAPREESARKSTLGFYFICLLFPFSCCLVFEFWNLYIILISWLYIYILANGRIYCQYSFKVLYFLDQNLKEIISIQFWNGCLYYSSSINLIYQLLLTMYWWYNKQYFIITIWDIRITKLSLPSLLFFRYTKILLLENIPILQHICQPTNIFRIGCICFYFSLSL